jgi:thiol:disulfide interchange protein DsbD
MKPTSRKGKIQQIVQLRIQRYFQSVELNYQVCKEVCINLEKKFTSIPASTAAVAAAKEVLLL